MTRARDLASLHSSGFSGTELVLDADGDTSITADTDDQVDIKVGGNDNVVITDIGSSRKLKIFKGDNDEIVLQSNAPDDSNNLRPLELDAEQIVVSTGASTGTSSTEAFRILAVSYTHLTLPTICSV